MIFEEWFKENMYSILASHQNSYLVGPCRIVWEEREDEIKKLKDNLEDMKKEIEILKHKLEIIIKEMN